MCQSRLSKGQLGCKKRLSFTNELNAVSSKTLSESKPIMITTDEYDDYQRYRSAIEWDSSFCTVSSENKGEPSPYNIVNLNNTKVKVMVDTGGAATNVIYDFTLNSLCNKANLIRLDKPFYGFGNPNKPLETL